MQGGSSCSVNPVDRSVPTILSSRLLPSLSLPPLPARFARAVFFAAFHPRVDISRLTDDGRGDPQKTPESFVGLRLHLLPRCTKAATKPGCIDQKLVFDPSVLHFVFLWVSASSRSRNRQSHTISYSLLSFFPFQKLPPPGEKHLPCAGGVLHMGVFL